MFHISTPSYEERVAALSWSRGTIYAELLEDTWYIHLPSVSTGLPDGHLASIRSDCEATWTRLWERAGVGSLSQHLKHTHRTHATPSKSRLDQPSRKSEAASAAFGLVTGAALTTSSPGDLLFRQHAALRLSLFDHSRLTWTRRLHRVAAWHGVAACARAER